MIIKWLLVGWIALSTILTVAMIGKQRTPITPAVAVFTLVLDVFWIVAVIIAWPDH